jgi:hypothetical protein
VPGCSTTRGTASSRHGGQRTPKLVFELTLERNRIDACEIEHEAMVHVASHRQDHFHSIRVAGSGKHTSETHVREPMLHDIAAKLRD